MLARMAGMAPDEAPDVSDAAQPKQPTPAQAAPQSPEERRKALLARMAGMATDDMEDDVEMSATSSTEKPLRTTPLMCYLDFEIERVELGRVEIELRFDVCPKTCENFRALCTGDTEVGNYMHTHVYRAIPGFMIQTGDYELNTGFGGTSIYGRSFPDENFTLKHEGPGAVAMANSGPDTNGAQFYILTGDDAAIEKYGLDGKHVVFGRVTKGMEFVSQIESLGSATAKGEMHKEVRIKRCGQLEDLE